MKIESQVTFDHNQSALVGNGKQLFGYLDNYRLDYRATETPFYYVTLVDIHNQTQCIELDWTTYDQIDHQYQSIQIENNESVFFWAEVNDSFALINWRLFKAAIPLSKLYPIFKASYDSLGLFQLMELVESIQAMPLRLFMRQVLEDAALMTSFVSIPASRRHHHSFPGGLLAHSLECAYFTKLNVNALFNLSENEREVATVAALLHDIGKVKTLGLETHTSIGRFLDHEDFTLSLLSEPLKQLQNHWPSGAEVLQYLLVWKENRGHCRFVSGNAIKMADRMSTSASINHMGFTGKPAYYQYSSVIKGAKTVYVNRLN